MEEIKAGDIMLGNWLSYTNENGTFNLQVEEIRPTGIIVTWNGGFWFVSYDKLKPIPLTEDMLLKAGGYKLPHMTVTDSVLFDIGRDRILSIGCIEDCNQMAWLQHIEGKKVTDLVCIHNYDYDGWLYLHTFQNLFKSLTGNDLKIEE